MAKISTREDTKEIALTIYNGGFGAVKEIRRVNLTGNETYNYKILESKDNYPTKIESIVTYIYDGEKEESREIFTIEYQEMK